MSELENQSQGPSLPVTYRVRQSVGSLIGRRFDYLLNGISHGQLSVSWPDGHVSKHGNRDENPMMVLRKVICEAIGVQKIW